ncbi:uncharacterized protein LOC131009391 [Salvia miltiorrhiza]|uniref:uncharacterized protein LOC131009391 n=1 Tax=Salvia miltiorrhiza TaxID=226208 RepID=UPI0025ACC109|nr:uncharacterized protein LOC131009391 [Salvia miltiorrhiza]
MSEVEAEEVKLHIKVVTNKEKTKVLFAEAGSDFTDVLLSFLLLPLGTIMNVLEKHYGDKTPVIGSLNTLYNGAANLDIIHFRSAASKEKLRIPPPCYLILMHRLKLNVHLTQPPNFKPRNPYDGVLTEGEASFLISDDLHVLPNAGGSIMKTLSTLGISATDMEGVETRDMTFGLNEIMALLKESLISSNPLTALVFPGRQMILATEGHILLRQIDQKLTSMNPKKMILQVMLEKSTKKLVFSQADYNFIDFLFCMLTVLVGRVEWFLGSNTVFKSINNLHRSIADTSKNMHLKTSRIKDLLIKCNPTSGEFCCLNFNSDENQCHVKQARMYMVRDDLTVAPFGVTSYLSVLNELKISLSDVEELELQVGVEEGLSLVKAALTSTTALTDGLIKPFLKKKAHPEMEVSKKKPKLEC